MTKKKYRNALPVGFQFGWYRINEVLGQGGFGITYLATNLNLDRQEALKEYLPREIAIRQPDHGVSATTDDDHAPFRHGLKGFIAEARTLAQFKHPHIVQVYNVFEAMGTAYMAMEYEQGHSLEAHLKAGEFADEDSLKTLLNALLGALEYMHERQFIHRDVKPANIFIRADASPVLLDFGSARIALGEETHTLTAMVTQGYAPFEQYHSQKGAQGPWTDIYALAATVYRAVSGRPPLDAVLRGNARLDDKPDPLVPAAAVSRGKFSSGFLSAIDGALAFKASKRPQSVTQWRALFEQKAPDSGGTAKPAVPRSRPHVLAVAIWGLAVLAVLAGGGWYAWQQDLFAPAAPESPRIAVVPAPAPDPPAPDPKEDIEHAAALERQRQTVEAELERQRREAETELAALREKAEAVADHLTKAEAAFGEDALVGTEPGTAESHYRTVLEMEADNKTARAGLQRIAGRLVHRAELTFQQGRLVEPAGDNALTHYQAVLAFEVDHQGARAGIERIAETLLEQAGTLIEQGRLEIAQVRIEQAAGAGADVGAVQRDLEIARREHLAMEKQRQETEQAIAQALKKANVALAANRLTTPPGDNALEYFRALSELSPGAAEVERGYSAIVAKYVELAARASREGAHDRAQGYLDKAARIVPDAPELHEAQTTLKAEVERARVEAERLAEEERQRRIEEVARRKAEADRRRGIPEMVAIKGGCFQMGSPVSEPGHRINERLHRVCVEGFSMGKSEVTFEQYDKFADATGRARPDDEGWGRGNRPAINVSWNDATAFGEWLSERTGQRFRLPTEAQWEYAARAGRSTAFPGGNSLGRNMANCKNCGSRWGGKQTAPVGSFSANAWGLFDTVGNVWEWTCSKRNAKYRGNDKHCSGRTLIGNRVYRGGSWKSGALGSRSARRSSHNVANRNGDLGFRIARMD